VRINRNNSLEITGTIKRLEGQAFPTLKQCQAFITQTSGHELVVATDTLELQSLLETAFITRSEVTVVYEPNTDGQNELKQIRFNAQGSPRRRFLEEFPCDSLLLKSGLSIDELKLVDYAKKAAEKLLLDFSDVVFTSGRRDVAQQASAMAGNVVHNRNWIAETYVPSPERDSLQGWVDANPEATAKDSIAAGLAGIMSLWTDDQKRKLSRHFSGQAFDVQPMSGTRGDDVKAAIKHLPNIRKFLENEGGLIIWHADFELADANVLST
jgi:hypothetical protein